MWSGTTADYISSTLRNARKTTAVAIINIPGASTLYVRDDEILAGSLSIDNACISGSAFELGAVYAGQLKMTINTSIDRFSLYGATITPAVGFYKTASSDEYYSIPMGTYTIAEAVRSGNWISITAYDNMIKFDKAIPVMGENYRLQATPYGFIADACEQCGVTLGTSATDIESWSPVSSISGDIITLGYSWKSSITTYRALISQVAAILGCYATIGRDGYLYLKRFTTPTTDDGKTWTMTSDADVKKRQIADYSVQFTAMQISFRYNDEKDYSPTWGNDTTSVYSFSTDLFYGIDSIREIQDVGDALLTVVTGISYTPIDLTIMGNPAIDVGDGVLFTDKDNTVISSYIMHSTWTHHGNHILSAPGANSAITSSSTGTQKTMQLINAATSGTVCRFFSDASTADASISSGSYTTLLSTTITAGVTGAAFLLGSVKFTTSTAGDFGLTITLNGTALSFSPQITADGTATLTFFEPVTLAYGSNTLVVSMAGLAGGAATVLSGNCIVGAFSSIVR